MSLSKDQYMDLLLKEEAEQRAEATHDNIDSTARHNVANRTTATTRCDTTTTTKSPKVENIWPCVYCDRFYKTEVESNLCECWRK